MPNTKREKIDEAAAAATKAIEDYRKRDKIALVMIFAGPDDGFLDAEVVAPPGLPDTVILGIIQSVVLNATVKDKGN